MGEFGGAVCVQGGSQEVCACAISRGSGSAAQSGTKSEGSDSVWNAPAGEQSAGVAAANFVGDDADIFEGGVREARPQVQLDVIGAHAKGREAPSGNGIAVRLNEEGGDECSARTYRPANTIQGAAEFAFVRRDRFRTEEHCYGIPVAGGEIEQ